LVRLGGEGRPVIGRFVIKNPYVPIEWEQTGTHYIATALPETPRDLKTAEEFQAWRNSDEIRELYASQRRFGFKIKRDGSFRIEDVVAGKYLISIELLDPRDPDALAYSRYLARFSQEFEAPVSPEQNSSLPLDLGIFEVSLNPPIETAKRAAPEFTALSMESKEIRLENFRGKYVLINFWATWCAPCIAELPYLREVQKKYGARSDFAILSLSVDKTLAEPKDFVAKNNMSWTQGYLGELNSTSVPDSYGIGGIPALFLVDPEGRLIGRDFKANTLVRELAKWLE
jgi:thiol-disulfide isomerase/thioredoxin